MTRLKLPNFSHASLKSLLDIQENGYLGQPRKVKGGYAQVDYPPAELDEVIIGKQDKLSKLGTLEAFNERRKQDQTINEIEKILDSVQKLMELGQYVEVDCLKLESKLDSLKEL